MHILDSVVQEIERGALLLRSGNVHGLHSPLTGSPFEYPWRYLAQDKNGKWNLYEHRPFLSKIDETQWFSSDDEGGDGAWCYTGIRTETLPDWDSFIVELSDDRN